jgi:hypothetical protein
MRFKLFLVLLLAVFAFSCDKDDDKKTPSQEEMLTANSTKSWKLSAKTDDSQENDETCKSSSARNQDNRWKFTKGGYFEFDRGTVTGEEDELCESCCSDIVNFYGTWEIANGKLIIMAEGVLVNGTKEPRDEEEILNETLKSLSEDKFEISTAAGDVATFVPAD